nr:MAG TPA: hypothetical protein [Caudoviricetes sp.]
MPCLRGADLQVSVLCRLCRDTLSCTPTTYDLRPTTYDAAMLQPWVYWIGLYWAAATPALLIRRDLASANL